MQYFSIPTCYFPSTVLFIDDNRDFLLNFVLQLDEWLAYRIFDSPFDALDLIQKKYQGREELSQRCLSKWTVDNQQKHSDYKAIYTEVFNPKRFNDIAVVVVDYSMPGMNGLEFCRQISNTKIKKILLAGKADDKVVRAALNEGLIHRSIYKNDPQVAELITQSIYELQWQYFQDMSCVLSRLLSLRAPSCVHNQNHANSFQQFRHEKEIVEFYLMDEQGSFLLLDVDANISFLTFNDEMRHTKKHDIIHVRKGELLSYHRHLQDIDEEELLLL